MPSFSRRSRHRLRTCDERLQVLFDRVVKDFDCTILQGHRGRVAQNQAFQNGRSRLQWPEGNHNRYPSHAIDVAPWPIDWDDLRRFYFFGGFVLGIASELAIPIRFGGDWDGDEDLNDQTFNDLVHFEIGK